MNSSPLKFVDKQPTLTSPLTLVKSREFTNFQNKSNVPILPRGASVDFRQRPSVPQTSAGYPRLGHSMLLSGLCHLDNARAEPPTRHGVRARCRGSHGQRCMHPPSRLPLGRSGRTTIETSQPDGRVEDRSGWHRGSQAIGPRDRLNVVAITLAGRPQRDHWAGGWAWGRGVGLRDRSRRRARACRHRWADRAGGSGNRPRA